MFQIEDKPEASGPTCKPLNSVRGLTGSAKFTHGFGDPARRLTIAGLVQHTVRLGAEFGHIEVLLAICTVHGQHNLARA